MKELFRFLAMLICMYIATSLLYTAIIEHSSFWLIGSSIWIALALRAFPPFRKKTEDEITDD